MVSLIVSSRDYGLIALSAGCVRKNFLRNQPQMIEISEIEYLEVEAVGAMFSELS